MEIHTIYLFSYFVAVVFLIAKLAWLILGFYHWSQKALLGQGFKGQRMPMNPLQQKIPWTKILIAVSGAVFGWAVISLVGARFVREWLLLILPALAILINELQLPKKDIYLLAVMTLFAGLQTHREGGLDIFERLTRVVDELPPGEVQMASREALQRRRSGLAVEQCSKPLHRLHPFLDEMIFTLRLTGWQASLAFDLALELLGQRASRQWDRTSRWMVFREQIRPFLQFSQAAILVALTYLVVEGIPAINLVWPSYTVIGWIGLECVLVSVLLYSSGTRTWMRRLMGSAFLIASLVPLWQYATLPHLVELQLQSVTHLDAGSSNIRAEQELIQTGVLDPNNSDLEIQVDNNSSPARPTMTPTRPTIVEARLQPQSLSPHSQEVNRSWFIPCCQPR